MSDVKHAATGRITRRDAMGYVGTALSAAALSKTLAPWTLYGAEAESAIADKFIVYVQLPGGFDGWGCGFLTPKSLAPLKLPTGVFEIGSDKPSTNPLVTQYQSSGPHIFNAYTQVLNVPAVSQNLLMATINPRTLGHEDGMSFQASGHSVGGDAGFPVWPAGLSQLISHRLAGRKGRIIRHGDMSWRGSTCGDVSVLSARNYADFLRSFVDAKSLSALEKVRKDDFHNVLKRVASSYYESHGDLTGRAQDMSTYLDSMRDGPSPKLALDVKNTSDHLVPADKSTNPAIQEIEKAMSFDEIAKHIQNQMTRNGTDYGALDSIAALNGNKDGWNAFFAGLRLSALLVASGEAVAQGMSLTFPVGGDTHGGGGQTQVPQQTSVGLAGIALFWSWLKAKNLADKVVVILSTDFSRSPVNPLAVGPTYPVRFENKVVNVVDKGTDHWPVGYMMCLGTGFPAGRIGGLADASSPCGSVEFNDGGVATVPAFTSTQIVWSLFYRKWPELFTTRSDQHWRIIKRYYPTFEEGDLVKPIVLKPL